MALRYSFQVRLSRGKSSLSARPWRESRRVVLLALVGVNVASFVAQFFLDTFELGFVRDYLALSNRGVHDAYAWQFVTAMLLYGGPWHFLGNLLVLYILGRDIESILGQRHFLYLFLSGAIGGELGHLFLMPSETLLYAASGGVAAVLIATVIAATPGSGRTRPTHDTGRIYRTRNRSVTGKNFAQRNAKSDPGRTSPSFSGARKDRLDLIRVSWR